MNIFFFVPANKDKYIYLSVQIICMDDAYKASFYISVVLIKRKCICMKVLNANYCLLEKNN